MNHAERAELLKQFRTPHGTLIGLTMTGFGPGEARTTIAYNPVFVGDTATGVLHGGLVTVLLDETCGLAVQMAIEELVAIATLDLRIDYMRPATPGLALNARAVCYRMTKSVAFVRAAAYQEDESKPVATVTASFMVGANRSDFKQHKSKVDFAQLQPLSAPEDPRGAFPESPYARALGVQVAQDGSTLLPYADKLIGNPLLPALHGGVLGAFLETTAMVGLRHDAAIAARPVPINITVNYLRSGKPIDTFGRARIAKQGRRIVAFEARAWQTNPFEPIASAYGHFMLKNEQADA
ncbi:MAG: hotdog fold thioesterase [Hyphomicrobiales bacterium]|nr:hotdog fold thioesterase [Hyphomicrobiales bacterium]